MKNLKEKYFNILVQILKENPGKFTLKDYRKTSISCTQCYVCGHKKVSHEFVMEWGEPFPIGSECLKDVQQAIYE